MNWTERRGEHIIKSGPAATPINYAYDSVDRLTARNSSSTQAYDAASEMCWSKAAVVASPTCSTVPSGATKYTYDTRGNRTLRTPSTGTATTFAYDEGNHLTGYNGAATYVYDGDGLRLSKTLTGQSAKRMVWDRSAGIPELLNDGTNSYVYGPDGAPLEQITSAGVVTFLHHDQLGSTRLITSTAGANVASYTFDAYGAQTAKTGTATTPLGFAGQYTDAESGLIYMRARYFDPVTGTFNSVDPLGSLGSGQNSNGYVGGDPLNRVDPRGLFWSTFGTRFVADMDGLTFGFTDKVRSWTGLQGGLDKCSMDYLVSRRVGRLTGAVAGGVLAGGVTSIAAGAGLAAGMSGGAVAGATETILLHGRETTLSELMMAGILGAAGGAAGGVGADFFGLDFGQEAALATGSAFGLSAAAGGYSLNGGCGCES